MSPLYLPTGYLAGQAAPGPDVALQVLPRHHGFSAWTFDPLQANNFSSVSANATLMLSKVMVPATISVATITTFIAANGTTLTNCYLGVYSSAGVLLGASSADQSAVWNAGAPKVIATAASVGTIVGGTDVFVWVAFQVGSGTSPTFPRALPGGSGSGILFTTVGQTATNADAATIASGNAALPASFTPASAAAAGAVRLWAALS